MSRWQLSILGLYHYDDTIFDKLVLPTSIDRDKVIQSILWECAEQGVCYADADTMRDAIELWSLRRSPIWERLYKTTQLEYDPISNYDRKEEWIDNTGSTGSTSTSSSNSRTDQIQGYNSNDFVDQGKSSGKSSASDQSSNTTQSKHSGHVSGNIGVTTSQQMIEAERQVSRFDLYAEIVRDFKQEFCIMIF